MKIRFTDTKQVTKGDYNAAINIKEGTLVLPASLQPLLRQCGATTPEAFFSVSESAPSIFMAHYGWTKQDTEAATKKLESVLRGFINDSFFDRPLRDTSEFAFGAVIPKIPPHRGPKP